MVKGISSIPLTIIPLTLSVHGEGEILEVCAALMVSRLWKFGIANGGRDLRPRW